MYALECIIAQEDFLEFNAKHTPAREVEGGSPLATINPTLACGTGEETKWLFHRKEKAINRRLALARRHYDEKYVQDLKWALIGGYAK